MRAYLVRAAGLGLLILLSACASVLEPVAPAGPPDVRMTTGLRAPPQAKFYADCIAQAATTGAYNTERDGGTLRFTCNGDLAKTFYDALGPWSATADSRLEGEGRSWRFTKKLIKDSYGIDHCSVGPADDYQCVVVLAVGPFIDQTDYALPSLKRLP
jgi:hypothetical protein